MSAYSLYPLVNGLNIRGTANNFNLFHDNDLIFGDGIAFAYVSSDIISIKRSNSIYVYSTQILEIPGKKPVPKLIGVFSTNSETTLTTMINGKTYVVGSDCTIKIGK
jgi:hypothetical protein